MSRARLAYFVVVAFVVGCLVAEILLRLVGLTPTVIAYKWQQPAPYRSSTQKTTLTPHESWLSQSPEIPFVESLTIEKGFVTRDPEIGLVHPPGYKGGSRMMGRGGVEYFNVTYTIDSEGRRLTPTQDLSRAQQVLFFGTSDVFGYGLQDNQTVPALFATQQSEAAVYNYANDLWSPASFLRLVKAEKFASDLDSQKRTTVIFVANPTHFARLTGSITLYRFLPAWPSSLPFVKIENGELNDNGFLSDVAIRDFSYRTLAMSSVLAYAGLVFPLSYDDDDIALYAAVLKGIENGLRQKFHHLTFVVVGGPSVLDSTITRALLAKCRSENLATLDYTELDTRIPQQTAWSVVHHPTVFLNEKFASELARDLPRLQEQERTDH